MIKVSLDGPSCKGTCLWHELYSRQPQLQLRLQLQWSLTVIIQVLKHDT